MKQTLKRIPGAMKTHSVLKSLLKNPRPLEQMQKKWFGYFHPSISLTIATKQEELAIATLQKEALALPSEIIDPGAPEAERKWRSFKLALRKEMIEKDPRMFLSWDVVSSTMGGTLSCDDYKKLTRYPFWKTWKEAILSHIPPTYQKPYFKLPEADGTTLYHAFNLAQHVSRTSVEVSSLSYIIDFGAGYGSMCALTRALGFTGTFVLFDWAEFGILQKFYLSLHGVDLSKIKFVSTLKELEALKLTGDGLLVATWSLSETSLAFRTEFLNAVHPKYYLLSYQIEFSGIDNIKYFRYFTESNPNVFWYDYPVYNFTGAGNHYLLGTRKT